MVKTSLLSRETVKRTDTENAILMADKVLIGLATKKGTDVGTLRHFRQRVNAVLDTLMQEGDGKGKRISGATDTEFDSQLAAYADVFTRGHIAKIG